MKGALLSFSKKLADIGNDFYEFARSEYENRAFKFHCLIAALGALTWFYDPQILYACILVLAGFIVGKAAGPYLLYLLALLMVPLLKINGLNTDHRLEFSFTDANYTAYIFYLLVTPLIIYRSRSERVSGWFNYILIIPAVISLSRGAILASFLLLLYSNKKYARYSLLGVVVVAILIYASIFPERSVGSDAERFYILQQIFDGNVFYANGEKFVNLYVYSPSRVDNLLHLHNTPVTWLIHVSQSVVSTAFYILLVSCIRAASFLLLFPALFLTVAPGPFYLLFGLSLGASNPFKRHL